MTDTRRHFTVWILVLVASPAPGEGLIPIRGEQPEQLTESIDTALARLAEIEPERAASLRRRVDSVSSEASASARYSQLQSAIDSACLLTVSINPESRVKVGAGPAAKRLSTGVWNAFLIKVHNQAGVTAPLRVFSDQAKLGNEPHSASTRWLEIAIHAPDSGPSQLTGSLVEYRVIKLRTQDTCDRAALVAIDVGQGTADIGFRNDTLLTFRCEPIE